MRRAGASGTILPPGRFNGRSLQWTVLPEGPAMQPKLPPELPLDPVTPPRPDRDDEVDPKPIDDLPEPEPVPARL